MGDGLKISLKDIPEPVNPSQHSFSSQEKEIIDSEINKLLKKKIIVPTNINEDDFVSSIFTRNKKDGSHRMILNLKKFNIFVDSPHFKMESIRNVISMVHKGVWMASVDLKDAFFTVPINVHDQKYLKFIWDRPYAFAAMPNGYSDAMRVFTKILKPPFAVLRQAGHLSCVYVDDSYLQGDTYSECQQNVHDTIELLLSLGFTIHPDKSVLKPTQVIIFLGFVINSVEMTITLTTEKKEKIKELCECMLQNNKLSIRDVAKLIGNLVAAFEAVPMGQLYYRCLETQKIEALVQSQGDFDVPITLNKSSLLEVKWWHDNIDSAFKSLVPVPITLIIYSDASDLGWGATNGKIRINGRWSDSESDLHINIQELMAAKIAIMSYCKDMEDIHVRIMADNMTAVIYINNMGGTKSKECNQIAKEIWQWAESRNIWISAAHIPGTDNVTADTGSRQFNDATEWMVSDHAFSIITKKFGVPDVDLFASRLNHKLPIYVSWKPDPKSVAVNAFSLSWEKTYSYCFPPFSIIWRVLRKIREDKAKAILVIPYWQTQSWFPAALQMCTATPVIFTSLHLQLPGTKTRHPLYPQLKLIALRVSGDTLKSNLFREQQRKLSLHHGATQPSKDTSQLIKSGKLFVVKGVLIPSLLLSQMS